MTAIQPIIAAAPALLVLWLALRLIEASRARGRARAGYLDPLKPLFDNGEVRLLPSGFPRLKGRRGELDFDVRALPDTLTFRKLPALWVIVSLPLPLPLRATLDLMARPSGQEVFSRFADLADSLPRPDFLPEGVAVRSDNAASVLPEELLRRHADLFDDPRVKELLISPAGLRIVILAEEADRGRYLIFRDAEMGLSPISGARIAPLIDRLERLRSDIIDRATEPT